jgi:L-seryl-tRNA(Ser) seleniumtransferase
VGQPDESAIGGGSLPGVTLPTWVLAIEPRHGRTVDQAAAELRRRRPPVVGRIADDRLVIDPRTVLPEDEAPLLEALATV